MRNGSDTRKSRVLRLSDTTNEISFPEDSQDIYHGDGVYQQVQEEQEDDGDSP